MEERWENQMMRQLIYWSPVDGALDGTGFVRGCTRVRDGALHTSDSGVPRIKSR